MARGRKAAIRRVIVSMAILSLFLACDSPLINQVLVAPVILEVKAGDGEVLVKWTPSEGEVEKYKVYYGTGTLSRSFNSVSTPDGTTFVKMVTDLMNGVKYHFAAVAVTGNGESPLSESKTATPVKAPPQNRVPGKPTITKITEGDGQVVVEWEAPIDTGIINEAPGTIIQYKIYASQTTIEPATGPPTQVSNGLKATISKLTNGTTYNIAVAAVNDTGDGVLSNVSTATPIAIILENRVPGKPSITNSFGADGSVILELVAPDDKGIVDGAPGKIIDYYIYIAPLDPEEDTSKKATSILEDGNNEVSVGGLINGVLYIFTAAARNSHGEGEPSKSKYDSPLEPNRLPGEPTGIGVTVKTGGVWVTWSPPADTGIVDGVAGAITTYNVYYDDPSAVTKDSKFVSFTGDEPLSREVPGLTREKTYQFAVTAVTATGEGDLSTPIIAIIKENSVPGQPTNVKAIPGEGKVNLEWKAPVNMGIVDGKVGRIIGYNIYVLPSNKTIFTSREANRAEVSALINGVTYRFTVAAENAHGESEPSEFVDATPWHGADSRASAAGESEPSEFVDATLPLK